jgi:hypothetical protein
MKNKILILLIVCTSFFGFAQSEKDIINITKDYDVALIKSKAKEFKILEEKERIRAYKYALENNIPLSYTDEKGNFHQLMKVSNYMDKDTLRRIEYIHRNISEFRQYRRNYYIDYINNNDENNEDIRYRFLYNEIDDKHFKSMLHARNKKVSLKKAVYEILISTSEIVENFMWTIHDINNKDIFEYSIEDKEVEVKKIIDILSDLRNDTNKTIEGIYSEHNYKPQEILGHSFYITRI